VLIVAQIVGCLDWAKKMSVDIEVSMSSSR